MRSSDPHAGAVQTDMQLILADHPAVHVLYGIEGTLEQKHVHPSAYYSLSFNLKLLKTVVITEVPPSGGAAVVRSR
jgi:hypothetical protein